MEELSLQDLYTAFEEAVKTKQPQEVVTEIQRAIEAKEAEEANKETYGQAVGRIASERGAKILDVLGEPMSAADPTTSQPAKALRVLGGQVVGGAAEAVTEGLERAVPFVFDTAEELFSYLRETELGREFAATFDKGATAIAEWAQSSPTNQRLLETIEGAINLSALKAPKVPLPSAGEPIEKTGAWIRGQAERSISKNRRKSIIEYLAPDVSKMSPDDIVEQGMFNTRRWNPQDQRTSDAIDYIDNTMPDFDPSKSAFKNRQLIDKRLKRLEGQVQTRLSLAPRVDKKQIIGELEEDLASLFDDALWKQKAEYSAASELFEIAADRIQKGKGTLSELLKLRRELDDYFGNSNYTAAQVKAGQRSITQLRNKINSIIERESASVGAGFQEKMKEMSNLLIADEHLRPKIIEDMENSFRNIFKRGRRYVGSTIPGMAAAAAAAGAGVSFLSSGTGLSLLAGGSLAGTATGVGYLALNRKSRKKIGQAIEYAGKARKAAEKAGDKVLVEQLKVDRLVLVEMLQNANIVEEQPEEQQEEEEQTTAPPPQAATQQTGQAAQIAGTIQNLRGFNQLPPQQVNARLSQLNDPMLQQAVMQQLYGTTP